jgi:predicted nucleotidyltransferase
MDKREDINDKVKNYGTLLKKSDFPMTIDKIFLFGSYAKGNPVEDSDIDIALIVGEWESDYFKVMPLIWKIRREVDWRIEPHVIIPEEDYAGLYDEIQRTGILIN